MREEQKAKYYNDAYSISPKYSLEIDGYNCQYKDLFKLVKSYLNKDELILELGCGTGQFADILIKENYNYSLGLDFSQVAVDMCKKRSGVDKFRCVDLYVYRFIDEYETIICIETLEHIKDDLKIIEKIKPNTKVIFSLPRFDNFAHVRYFIDENSIRQRYENLLNIKSIVLLGKIFVIEAVKI